jgi:transposase
MPTRRKPQIERHVKGSASKILELRNELQKERQARQKAERRSNELEKRCLELEHKVDSLLRRVDELTKKNDELVKGRWKTEDFLQGKIRQLEKAVIDRDEKLDQANKQLEWFRKQQFSQKSEKGIPDENESESEPASDIQEDIGKRKRGQQPKSKGHGRTQRNIETPEEEELELEGCSCDMCGMPYLEIVKTTDSLMAELKTIVFWTLYKRHSYVSQCNCKGKKIVTAPPPPRLYPRTQIGNSIWVYLAVHKFLRATPTSRTLQDLELQGFKLAQGTVTGGFKNTDKLLDPLYQAILNHCRGGKLWNADETTWRVFDSDNVRWWLWIIASEDAIVYLLDRSRSKKVPTEFFAGSAGTLITDRLASYKGLQESIQKALCWIHQRRDILNIYNGVKKLRPWAKDWLHEIKTLFVLNHNRLKLWEEGKNWSKAQNELESHIANLERTWEAQLQLKELHKLQKKVLLSFERHWKGLTVFLRDPRIPMHNNRAERLLRNSVIVRKNSYGSGSEWSGHLAAKYFSIFQTWLINGLDPQKMLQEYFDACAQTPGKAPTEISAFLPWLMTDEQKIQFVLPKKYPRPG